jgi:hypothetical protein
MEWLTQNWIWLVLIVGVVIWLLSRSRHGGLMGGCSTHGMAHEGPVAEFKGQGADAARPPIKEEKAGQPAEPAASSHRHGRGGCC